MSLNSENSIWDNLLEDNYKKYPSIRSGFACLDDFVLITKEGNYVGPSFFRIFLNLLFLFMLSGVITTALDIGLAYLTIWNVGVADFLSEFTFVFQLILFLIVIKFLPLTKYHSLEHKVANLIDMKKEINYENVKNITGYSRYCGSNLVGLFVGYMIMMPLFTNILNFSLFWSVILAVTIGMVTSFDKIFGKWIQETFALQEPTEKQIKVAVEKGNDLLKQYEIGEKIPYINLKIIMVGIMAFSLVVSYRGILTILFGG
jgi:uncharacterized protein YqhQ